MYVQKNQQPENVFAECVLKYDRGMQHVLTTFFMELPRRPRIPRVFGIYSAHEAFFCLPGVRRTSRGLPFGKIKEDQRIEKHHMNAVERVDINHGTEGREHEQS